MSVQFPATPSVGFSFIGSNGVQYTWDGSKWLANKENATGGGGGGSGLWTRDSTKSVLYPMKTGDGVTVYSKLGTESINLSEDGTVVSETIGFDKFKDLPT